jgi:Uncharacterised nucleotidyltransferase
MTPPPPETLWTRVDSFVERAPRTEDLLHHRLAAIAAGRRDSPERSGYSALEDEERFAAWVALAARAVLDRVLTLYDKPVMVLKGPELACRYPDPRFRPYHDLDLLVEDSASAQRALLAAGCRPAREHAVPHHESPLVFPDLPLVIELHHRLKPLEFARLPDARRLLGDAVPSRWDPRVLAPPPAQHAALVAAHAWDERPLRRIIDLVDVELLLTESGRDSAADVARVWGLERVWDCTLAAVDALFHGGAVPWTVRTWARNLPAVRERRRAEDLLTRMLAPFGAFPPRRAARVSVRNLLAVPRGRSGASWPGSLRRAPYDHPALAGDTAEVSSRATSPARD